jgi:dTDP-4-dehydrorhamnose reductase
MKKVLVTGVSGQVGYEVAQLLSGRYEVVTSGNGAVGDYPIDLADAESVRLAVRHIRPDIIINCGAYTQVDKAETDRELAFQINCDAPQVFAEEARKLGSLLIHFSTDYVFPGTGQSARQEADPVGPINIYGESKLAGEVAITESGCDYIILRTSWVFSSRGHNFVKTMLRLAKDRTELGVVADQIGAPTSAKALARAVDAILDAMTARPSKDFTGIYHCTCSGEVSWQGFAEEIFAQAKRSGVALAVKLVKPLPTTDYPTPARRPLNSRLNCAKFTHSFGYKLPSWQEELAEVLSELAQA